MTTREWPAEVDGQSHTISIERGENGKDLIRVDGKMAARPLAPHEKERTIPVGGSTWIVRRDLTGELSVSELDSSFADQVTHPAMVIPSRVAELPLGPTPSGAAISIPLWGWVSVVVLGLGVMLWMALGPSYEKQAQQRVKQILTDMAQGTQGEVQFAVGIWARNVRTLADRDELSWASDHFDSWRREKDVYRKFSDWEVVGAEEVEGAPVPTAIVTVKIEGRELKMLVPERKPISWTD